MEFEWDDRKNETNIEKHGIDFSDIPEVFNHPLLVIRDDRKDYGEEHWIGTGPLKMIIVLVVFTEPDSDTIRIISARKATKYERKEYEKKVKN